MFKVGDRVKVVKAVDSIVEDIIGQHGVIKHRVREDDKFDNLWRINLGNDEWYVYGCELEHDKEHQVLEILRKWRDLR